MKNLLSGNIRIKVIWAFTICSAAAIIVLGGATWPSEDDFCLTNMIKDAGNIMSFTWMMYNNWGGRILNYIFFGLLYKDPYTFNIFVILLSVVYILNSFLMTYLWKDIFFPGVKRRFFILPASAMLCVLWLAQKPIMNMILYWLTGAIVYTLKPFLLMVLLSIIYLMLFKNMKVKKWIFIILCILAFFTATGNQMIPPPAFFLIFSMLYLSKNGNTENRKNVYIISGFFLLGSLVMYAAPGNFVRAAGAETSFVFSPSHIIKSYLFVLVKFLKPSMPLFGMSILVSILCSASFYMLSGGNTGGDITGNFSKNRYKYIFSLSFLAAAFLSILPLALVPKFTNIRTSLYFQLFTIMSIWGFSASLTPSLMQKLKDRHKIRFMPATTFIIVVLNLAVIAQASRDAADGYKVRKYYLKRDAMLKALSPAEKDKNITVDPPPGRVPSRLYNCDVSSLDKDFWVNKEVAKYYGLRSIVQNSDFQKFKDPKQFF